VGALIPCSLQPDKDGGADSLDADSLQSGSRGRQLGEPGRAEDLATGLGGRPASGDVDCSRRRLARVPRPAEAGPIGERGGRAAWRQRGLEKSIQKAASRSGELDHEKDEKDSYRG
jgi:hypothetical protein